MKRWAIHGKAIGARARVLVLLALFFSFGCDETEKSGKIYSAMINVTGPRPANNINNAEGKTTVVLPSEKLKFKAKLSPDDTGVTCTWSFTGAAGNNGTPVSPIINQNVTWTAPSLPDTVTVSLKAEKAGETFYDKTFTVYVLKVNLKSVDFLGAGNHTLRKQGADAWSNDKFGDDGDVAIDYPEWQDNDLDGTADKDEPVCYTKSSSPKMTAVLAVSPSLTATVTAKLRVKKGSTTLVTTDVGLSGNETTVSDLAWAAASALPATLLTSDYTLTWSISLDGGSTYTSIGTSVNRFFVVLDTPNQVNSFGSGNKLTCKRISEVLDNAGTTANVGTIASNIQKWRDDAGIDNTGATTGVNGTKIWTLLDLTEKGQCAEGSLLMEQAIRLLGIPAEYQHVLPAVSLPVPVHSAASPATAPTRTHDSTTETLYLYFTSAGDFTGWNVGEGCCLVDGKLYAAWTTGYLVGKTGGVVHGKTAVSAAHHILLQLANGMPDLQRWRKANGAACDSGDTVPVP